MDHPSPVVHEQCNTGINPFLFQVECQKPQACLVAGANAFCPCFSHHWASLLPIWLSWSDSQTCSDFPTQNLDPNSCCQTSLNAQTSYLDWQPCIIQTALFPVLFSYRNTHLLPGFSEFSHLPTFLCNIPFFSYGLPVSQNLHLLLQHLLPKFIMLPRVRLAVVW